MKDPCKCTGPLFLVISIGQENSQIAEIVPGRSNLNRIPESAEKRVSIESFEGGAGVKTERSCAIERCAISDRAGGGTVAIHSVGARAEYGDVLTRNFRCTGERELLVAPTNAAVRNFDRYFATGDQTNRGKMFS